MDTGFSCRKNAFFPGVHKIGAPISGPRIADTNFTDTRIFLNFSKVLETARRYLKKSICSFKGGGIGGREENCPKNAVLLGKTP